MMDGHILPPQPGNLELVGIDLRRKRKYLIKGPEENFSLVGW